MRGNYPALEDELKQVSRQALEASLSQRYAGARSPSYSDATYFRHFKSFTNDYPVILSTCHSLRRSIPTGFLLDYLIIDEASQVDLLAAGLALSCARNVIVVGDLKQLPHIPERGAAERARPAPAPELRLWAAQHPVLNHRALRRWPSPHNAPRTLPLRSRNHRLLQQEVLWWATRPLHHQRPGK